MPHQILQVPYFDKPTYVGHVLVMRWLWFESSPYFQECKVDSKNNSPVRPHQGLDQSPISPRPDQISAPSSVDPPPLGDSVLH